MLPSSLRAGAYETPLIDVQMPRVLLTLRVHPTSGAVGAALTSVLRKCPECTPGWMVARGRDDWIFPEESESEMMGRLCESCSRCPASFCNGGCLKVSYDRFCQERFDALCHSCDAIMCGEQWAAVCTRCEGAFCAKCASTARA